MSAGLDSSNAVELVSAVAQQSFNPTAMSRLEGHPVVRFPEQLRRHRALEGLGWTGAIDEFNNAARLTNPSVTEPILITANGTILAGFGRWRLALFEGKRELNCIEYPLSEDESLQFILTYHQSRGGWNDFVHKHNVARIISDPRCVTIELAKPGKVPGDAVGTIKHEHGYKLVQTAARL
jgi:hypothetical protein